MMNNNKYESKEVTDALDIIKNETIGYNYTRIKVNLLNALNEVITEDIYSPEDFPQFKTSIMDGYAMKIDKENCDTKNKYYSIMDNIHAGDIINNNNNNNNNEIVYVTTGSRIPNGYNAVVKIEDTELINDNNGNKKVLIKINVKINSFIREIGSDIKKNSLIIRKNTKITSIEISLLLTIGINYIYIYKLLKIGIISTGNELVDYYNNIVNNNKNNNNEYYNLLENNENSSNIRDTNKLTLITSLMNDNNIKLNNINDYGIIKDDYNLLLETFNKAINIDNCDIILTSGGVSMGNFDFVKQILYNLGTIKFGKLNMKPGKPTTFAVINRNNINNINFNNKVFVFGLPGNPVSCLVCKTLFVNPLINILQNGGIVNNNNINNNIININNEKNDQMIINNENISTTKVTEYSTEVIVTLQDISIKMDPERPEYHRCIVFYQRLYKNDSNLMNQLDTSVEGKLVAYSTGPQQSSRILSLQGANALLKIPAGTGTLTKGHQCEAILLSLPLSIFVDENNPLLNETTITHSLSCACCANSTMKQYYSQIITSNNNIDNNNNNNLPKPHTGNPPKTTKLPVKVGILTVSDRASEGIYPDTSGPEIAKLLNNMCNNNNNNNSETFYPLDFIIYRTCIVPDNKERIQSIITEWCKNKDEKEVDLIITTGGTGFGLKDYTPEAIKPLLTREAPGIAQALLSEGLKHTPLALLSRPIAGTRYQTFICTLPGSTKAIKENIVVLKELLPRIMELLILNQCS